MNKIIQHLVQTNAPQLNMYFIKIDLSEWYFEDTIQNFKRNIKIIFSNLTNIKLDRDNIQDQVSRNKNKHLKVDNTFIDLNFFVGITISHHIEK